MFEQRREILAALTKSAAARDFGSRTSYNLPQHETDQNNKNLTLL